MALYRLQILKQPVVPKPAEGLLSIIWKNVGDPILDMRSDYTIPVYHYSKIFNVKIDRDYWRNKNPVFPQDTLPGLQTAVGLAREQSPAFLASDATEALASLWVNFLQTSKPKFMHHSMCV